MRQSLNELLAAIACERIRGRACRGGRRQDRAIIIEYGPTAFQAVNQIAADFFEFRILRSFLGGHANFL